MEITRSDFEGHISSKMNQSLEDLFNHVLEMGGLVEKQLDNAVLALQNNDVAMARETMLLDKLINASEMQIDKMCTRVLARQQPAAADLRLIIASIRIAVDLERMGDEVVKIARLVVKFNDDPVFKCVGNLDFSSLLEIAARSKKMLKTTLDSYARVTVEGTVAVIAEEEDIDVVYKEAMAKLVDAIKQESGDRVVCLLELSVALRACERISDHVRNIAEMIVYLVQGKDVRDLDLAALNQLLVR